MLNQKIRRVVTHTQHPLDRDGDKEVVVELDPLPYTILVQREQLVHPKGFRQPAEWWIEIAIKIFKSGSATILCLLLKPAPIDNVVDGQLTAGNAVSAALSCKGWTDEGKLSMLFDLARSFGTWTEIFLKSGQPGEEVRFFSALPHLSRFGRSIPIPGA